jgi:hypothetical protein
VLREPVNRVPSGRAEGFRATWLIRLEQQLVGDAGASDPVTRGTSVDRRRVRDALGAIRGTQATLAKSQMFEMMHNRTRAGLDPAA